MINKTTHKILKQFLDKIEPSDDQYLFKSRKGSGHPTIGSVNVMVKNWSRSINLKGNYETHTLRKTFGYIQRKKFGVGGGEILCKRFNHSSPSVTMRYLEIEDKEVNGILMNEI